MFMIVWIILNFLPYPNVRVTPVTPLAIMSTFLCLFTRDHVDTILGIVENGTGGKE